MEEQITTDALFYSSVTLDIEVAGKLFWVCTTDRRLIISPNFLRRLAAQYEYPYEEGVTTFLELLSQISRRYYTRYSRFFRSANWLYVNCPANEKKAIEATGLVDHDSLPSLSLPLYQGYTNNPVQGNVLLADVSFETVAGLLVGGHQETLAAYPHTTTTADIHDNIAVGYALYSLNLDFIITVHQTGIRASSPCNSNCPYTAPRHPPPCKRYLTVKFLNELCDYLDQYSFSFDIHRSLRYVVAAHDIPECWEYLETRYADQRSGSIDCCVTYSSKRIFARLLTRASNDKDFKQQLDDELASVVEPPAEIKSIYYNFFHQPFPCYTASRATVGDMLSVMGAVKQDLETEIRSMQTEDTEHSSIWILPVFLVALLAWWYAM